MYQGEALPLLYWSCSRNLKNHCSVSPVLFQPTIMSKEDQDGAISRAATEAMKGIDGMHFSSYIRLH